MMVTIITELGPGNPSIFVYYGSIELGLGDGFLPVEGEVYVDALSICTALGLFVTGPIGCTTRKAVAVFSRGHTKPAPESARKIGAFVKTEKKGDLGQ
jgi:hypothetical protein